MKIWLGYTDKGIGVPYPPEARPDGNINHGYMDLKRDPSQIDQVPEIQDLPPLKELVRSLNTPTSIVRTLGSEKAYSNSETPLYRRKLVSYVDIAFEIVHFNQKRNFEVLFERFREFCPSDTCSAATGIQFEIGHASYKEAIFPFGAHLTIWNLGYGNSDKQATRKWVEGVQQIKLFFEEESRLWADQLNKGYKTIS